MKMSCPKKRRAWPSTSTTVRGAYHAESTCYGMSGAPERTLYEAIEMGKPPCSRCDPPTLDDLE